MTRRAALTQLRCDDFAQEQSDDLQEFQEPDESNYQNKKRGNGQLVPLEPVHITLPR